MESGSNGPIDVGLVRVGNDESAAQGRHGASTLHADHLEFESDLGYVTLTYTAKSGKERTVVVEDDEFVEVLHDLADTDAERLFWYLDDDGSVAWGENQDVWPPHAWRSR